ncbi:MAG: Stp1/IreP family PP2C-type Ser/Thr phosphatase [Defluviitaleaceae bacterium]|nr:Stp1/IreP family PP2C-type Ser/Thr phosphatase [Defluviitaleaceae bacterium]
MYATNGLYAAGITDVGVTRKQNQDAIFVWNKPIGPFPNLFIVADGMGGHNAGDVASNIAVEEFGKYVHNYAAQQFIQQENFLDLMLSAAQHANNLIIQRAESDEKLQGMGTTLTTAVITNEKVFVAHIGDSRAYIVTHSEMKKITADHTFVEELLQSGHVSPEEALAHPKRHVLTRALGIPEKNGNFGVDGIVKELGDATAVLLCSDGLSNMLENDSMMRIINGLGYVETRARYLVDEANKKGGLDNISAVLVDIGR